MSSASTPTASARPKISLVIPAYNEAQRITQSLSALLEYVKGHPSVEAILVVEKSTDDTLRIAHELVGDCPQFQIIGNSVHLGKGYAVKTGMLSARGEFVFFMDLDLSTPLSEVARFVEVFELRPDIDVLIGSRQHPQSQILRKQNPIRQKMGQTFNTFLQMYALKGIPDTQCGFKAFRAGAVQPVFSRQTVYNFAFDVEILVSAAKQGFRIQALPVRWINSAESKVRMVRDSLRMLVTLVRIKKLTERAFYASPMRIQTQWIDPALSSHEASFLETPLESPLQPL